MCKRHTCFTQPAQVELRSAAMQVVESGHLRLRMAALEGQRDTRSHEAGSPGYQDALMDLHIQWTNVAVGQYIGSEGRADPVEVRRRSRFSPRGRPRGC